MHPVFNGENNAYQWALRVVVHDSFSFILGKPLEPPKWALANHNILDFVAGFFDAEGSIFITTRIRHNRWRVIETSLSISNTRKGLLRVVALLLRDYHPTVELYRRKGPDPSAYRGIRKRNQWRLIIRRRVAVERLLREWSIRHPEKVLRSNIALATLRGLPYVNVQSSVRKLRRQIRKEIEAFATLAAVQSRISHELASKQS